MPDTPAKTALAQPQGDFTARLTALTAQSQGDFQSGVSTILSDPKLDAAGKTAAVNALGLKFSQTIDPDKLKTAIANGQGSVTADPAATGGDNVDTPDIVVTAPARASEFAAPDHRVRLSAYPGQETDVYGPDDRTKNILSPLHKTNGLLFPYTPTIQVSQDTSWQAADLEQTNYDILSFQKSASASISLTAKFTAQNQREGEYMMAAIHFLRTVSKTYFGEKDADTFKDADPAAGGDATAATVKKTAVSGRAGLPPPVLIFSGYGDLLFNNVRCVVRSHSWAFDENIDMVKFTLPNGSTIWLPPVLSISIGLAIQMNTDDLRQLFSLDDFRTGALLTGSTKGWF